MTSPINNFQDILNALERDPALRDALRRHILTDELLQMPVRLERVEVDVKTLKEDVSVLKEDVSVLKEGQSRLESQISKMSGDLSRMMGDDYESHVATYAHRFLRRNLGISATLFSCQRTRSPLTRLLDEAEAQGRISARETDELDRADLILATEGPTDYILAEVSLTIQQDDIDRAAHRAVLLAKATAQTVAPFAFGAREQPGIRGGDVRVILIPEAQAP